MSSPSDIPGLPEIPSPVTLERVAALAAGSGFTTADDGASLRRRADGASVEITLPPADGAVLLFRGVRIGNAYPSTQLRALEAFVNDWHRDRVWPVIVLTSGDQGVAVHAHVGADVTAGLTDVQLAECVRIGVGTIQQCFATLAEATGAAGASGSENPDP